MEELIEKLISVGMEQFMEKSRTELTEQDKIYRKDVEDADYLEQLYRELGLSRKEMMIINDYIACIQTADSRYADISYTAGIIDTVKCLYSWGNLKI